MRNHHQDPERFRQYGLKWKATHPNYTKEYYKKYNKLRIPEKTTNFTRSKEAINARNKALFHKNKYPLAKYCEICPEDEIRLATQRHHPDYNYAFIFFSVCHSCHTAHHRQEKKLVILAAKDSSSEVSK